MKYVRIANQIIVKQHELKEIWYNKIRSLCNKDIAAQTEYQEGQFWITPSGIDCYYDNYLECIQVPACERSKLLLSHLPQGVNVQFLDDTRNANDLMYGSLEHIRLHRADAHKVNVIWMQPVAYRSTKDGLDSNMDQKLEDGDMLSEQQDFGYLRHNKEIEFYNDQTVTVLLTKPQPYHGKAYNRFEELPENARFFVKQLSYFQQAVYEEFLLTMQPLACHMIRKQMLLRSEHNKFSKYSIQDVIATVRLLENTGLIERRQGLQLNYYDTYMQGEERRLIQDHMGRPIVIDTWIWAAPKG